jgi:hybrid cluster-associated redox disulfide protein
MITKENTIAEVLQQNRQTARVFVNNGMFCLSCPYATGESLADACAAHGVDVDELVRQLNDFPQSQS